MQTIAIVIPSYNEEKRIKKTITTYADFFKKKEQVSVTLIIALNGCTDNTKSIVQELQKEHPSITMIEAAKAGKGIAIKEGFLHALTLDAQLIGFVDADMATEPHYFNDLIKDIDTNDGIIASRYMKESHVNPPRPFIKTWGRIIFYNSLIKILFGLWYKDLQCGAKLFKRYVIEKVAPKLTVDGWAIDLELLYLCKKMKFKIKEVPTVWYDQEHSKLNIWGSGLTMLTQVITLRIKYFFV